MQIFPAIDLIDGKAVRLVRGDYAQKTVYSDNPAAVARGFAQRGAGFLHVVDLDGARTGKPENLETIRRILSESGLKTEIGGGVRDEATVASYLEAGAYRVILGTAAITKPGFVRKMAASYGERIAVGVDIKDGYVAIKGWTELSAFTCLDFCASLQDDGVKTVVCTDISKDGLLGGANIALYRDLLEKFFLAFVASGGISTLEDVRTLAQMGMHGAILGKALYTGRLDLEQALAAAKEVI